MPYPLVTLLLVLGAVLFSSPFAVVWAIGIAVMVSSVALQLWLQAGDAESVIPAQITEPSSPPDEY